jgi:uncharacterized protein YndB with AHSA1/START domain
MTEELRIEHLIDAPPNVVFDAFTTHEGQVAFYDTDEPGWIVESDCDLRVGGRWTVRFGPSPARLYQHANVFTVIDPPHRIEVATTELHPDRPSFSFTVEFAFEDRDGKTLMVVTQSGFPTPELREEHGRGVPNAFAQFEHAVHARRRRARRRPQST